MSAPNSHEQVVEACGQKRKPMSAEQIHAMEYRHKLRKTMLSSFVHAHQTGNWTPLINFFRDLEAEYAKRQAAEARIAAREFRKTRKVSRKLSSCAYTPTTTRPLYINVKSSLFDEGRIYSPSDYYIATPTVLPQLNSDFTFELAQADCICDLEAIKAWLLKTATDSDATILRGLGLPEDLASVMRRIKLPAGATLVYVAAVYFTDIFATNDLWKVESRNAELATVIDHKMRMSGLIKGHTYENS